ncbi:MAG: MltA domain-containing protein [Rhizomicrobium sp.]
MLAGCQTIPGPAGTGVTLQKQDFSDLPGWRGANLQPAYQAFVRSCGEINARSATAPAPGLGYGGTNGDWQMVCRAVKHTALPPKRFFEQWFQPFSLVASGTANLFTGYYEPEIAVSRVKDETYQTPIYGLPSDLVSVDLGLFRDKYKGEKLVGRLDKNRLTPYPARAEIENKGIKAPILFYAADPVAVFFLQIQGSGRGVLPDGSQVRLVYAGQNGKSYTAIGKVLAAQGAIARDQITAQSIRDWLKSHPDEAVSVMQANESYVFFAEEHIGSPSLGAKGSEGVPLTAEASIAVDPRFHPYGLPVFIATTKPSSDGAGTVWQSLFIAQDRGGAIRGAGRADLYLGVGGGPEKLAGLMKQPGDMFILLPRAVAERLPGMSRYDGPQP